MEITRVYLAGNSYFSEAKIYELTSTPKEKLTNSDAIDIFIKTILDLYLANGFLFAQIQLFIDEEDRTSTISILEGKRVSITNYVFQGNKISRDLALLKISNLKSVQTITPRLMQDAERRITSKQYISSCNILPVNEQTLLINVQEDRMTYLSALLGYVNNKEQRSKLTGFIDAHVLNIFGSDRSLSIAWKQLPTDLRAVSLQYHESGPLNISLAGNISFAREERDSTSTSSQVEMDLYYYFDVHKLGILAGFQGLYPGSRRPALLVQQKEKNLGLFWEGDWTDDFFNPHTGWRIYLQQSMLFVTKENHSLRRNKTEFRIGQFTSLGKSLVLANTITGRQIENKSLTYYDLYAVGGAFSLRGFLENQYAGDSVLYTNTELRYQLTRTARIFLFVDYGYLEDNRPEFQNQFYDLLGLGFGMRFDTKIGLLRIDYGVHQAEGKWLNPMQGIVHFGIEMGF